MDHSEPSSGIAMSVPGHDARTALQTTHTWLSNPSSQNDYTKNAEDDFLGNLALQIPPSRLDFPAVASFSPANDGFEHELPAFERYHAERVPLQSFSDYKEASNYGFAPKHPQQQRLRQEKKTRMLECTCLERFSLCLMTCIICKKLVSVNSKTLQSEKQGGSSEVSNRNYTKSIPGLNLAVENWQQEQTSRAAVRVGDFKVDSEIAGRLRLYVILEDVERLRTLMERLSGRSTDENLTAILHGLLERLDKCPFGANIMLNS
ncbi:hypothetical protein DSL72_005795 [Monilinia vaccinii-corymbosi]|uniref:Aflatoxin regulatory protein domain-containing protein n=1 Tax=Monilinia vaccinii-corymbosi TaxID=61207 RepID=A0A8A3PGT8_9HELO|nr:hypothetical protein DSL72_005795 [Monilinia vaccinii-corymbosi]